MHVQYVAAIDMEFIVFYASIIRETSYRCSKYVCEHILRSKLVMVANSSIRRHVTPACNEVKYLHKYKLCAHRSRFGFVHILKQQYVVLL